MLAGGVAAGAFGSILGLGGGILIVPLLTLVFGLPLREAVAVSLVCVIVQFVFPWEMARLGGAGTFFIYGAFGLIGVVVLWRLVPETRGRSLEEIEESLVRRP